MRHFHHFLWGLVPVSKFTVSSTFLLRYSYGSLCFGHEQTAFLLHLVIKGSFNIHDTKFLYIPPYSVPQPLEIKRVFSPPGEDSPGTADIQCQRRMGVNRRQRFQDLGCPGMRDVSSVFHFSSELIPPSRTPIYSRTCAGNKHPKSHCTAFVAERTPWPREHVIHIETSRQCN